MLRPSNDTITVFLEDSIKRVAMEYVIGKNNFICFVIFLPQILTESLIKTTESNRFFLFYSTLYRSIFINALESVNKSITFEYNNLYRL